MRGSMYFLSAKISVLVIFLCLSVSSHSQSVFARVDNWLDNHSREMGGRTILVIYKDGQLIYNKSVNEMSQRQKIAGKFMARRQGKEVNLEDYTFTTRQAIASCSKWLSTALIMTFIDEGKLKLSDTAGKYLPVLSQHGKGNITISDCLSHLTGVKAPPLKESLGEMKNIASMEEAIENIAALPMEGEHGKVFHYSNVGLQIAGAVIEKISGKNFETLFAERIAGPLGMKNTDFGKGKVALPAGGASSTPQDYLNFLGMILNKGIYQGVRILSEKSINEMETDHVNSGVRIAYSPAEAANFGYGYGEWIMENPAKGNISKAVTSPGLFGSFPWVDNEKKYCGFLMCFYFKSEGRNKRYKELKQLVDEAIK